MFKTEAEIKYDIFLFFLIVWTGLGKLHKWIKVGLKLILQAKLLKKE